MRVLLPAFFALIIGIFGTPAMAEAKFWGEVDHIVFVSQTDVQREGEPQALCAHVTDRYFLHVPLRRNTSAYSLSSSGCWTTNVTPLSLSQTALYQSKGLIPAHVSVLPHVSLHWSNREIITLIVFAALTTLVPALLLQWWRAVEKQPRRVSSDPFFEDILLSVIFHVARADGVIAREDVTKIRGAYRGLTGDAIPTDVVSSKIVEFMTDEGMLNMAQRFRGREAEALLDTAIFVAARHGYITPVAMDLLYDLNDVLEQDENWFQHAIKNALPNPAMQTVPATA